MASSRDPIDATGSHPSDHSEEASTDRPRTPAPERDESMEDALARARGHAQASIAEALASISALLDAVSLASSGELASVNGILAPAMRALEDLRNQFSGQDHESLPLIESIAEALDTEIARWEERARDDPNARSVLRAFLGLRELLWEFGVRTSETAATGARAHPSKAKNKSVPRRKKVQRVTVEG